MVAMSGATMPEPLAIPASVTGTPWIAAVAIAPLAKVSVVMIACAAASMPSARRPAASSSTRAVIFSTAQALADHAGGGDEHLVRPAAERRCHRLRLGPDGGVALAAPEHVGIAGIDQHRPRPAVRPGSRGTTAPGWPAVVERVNTPATVLPAGTSIRVRSWRLR